MTASTTDPVTQHEQFHRRREQAVVRSQGNLALVNTQWIDHEQTVWGVPGVWAPLPNGQSGLLLTADTADGILVDGALVEGQVIVAGRDAVNPSDIRFSDNVTGFVIANEEGGYGLRVWDSASEDIQRFGGIDVFPYDPRWVIEARFEEVPGGLTVGFSHLKDEGRTRERVIPGEIRFTLDGADYALVAFKSGKALQLVFADATNGDSTYSVGRFLFVTPRDDGTVTLDFNRAVLPPCAFSYHFNCPLPPKQNRFAIPIEAGEKNVLAKDGSLLH
ncbi:DUF1684 domain-containing protein [Herbiconiux sp. SYSU D00978]|uniref:DUF1684 domain-containing protein n=1 Tax=Herbiconiux sp. SYSU D00978 TaxID=2812562 RepID=UPI001A968676|nr:DUF1684 domain-containing protein [Herbiconiux sp. SYSU D00978]